MCVACMYLLGIRVMDRLGPGWDRQRRCLLDLLPVPKLREWAEHRGRSHEHFGLKVAELGTLCAANTSRHTPAFRGTSGWTGNALMKLLFIRQRAGILRTAAQLSVVLQPHQLTLSGMFTIFNHFLMVEAQAT